MSKTWSEWKEMQKGPYSSMLLLCGTLRYGKSHSLAACAALGLQEGMMIVYISDGEQYIRSTIGTLVEALFIAYARDGETSDLLSRFKIRTIRRI